MRGEEKGFRDEHERERDLIRRKEGKGKEGILTHVRTARGPSVVTGGHNFFIISYYGRLRAVPSEISPGGATHISGGVGPERHPRPPPPSNSS